MAHNSKRNQRHTTVQEGDDYVYPTKKVRNQTRSRRSDKNLIQKGLVDLENQGLDDFAEAEIADWYDDTPMASEDDIDDFYNKIDEEERIENEEAGNLHDDLMGDYGYDWEDY